MTDDQVRPDAKLPARLVESRILALRGLRVMIDRDLATLYGISTSNLNKAVSRNLGRFPADFMFRLSSEEARSLMFQTGTSSWGGTRKLPRAFTEQGVAMLSSVLRSERAVRVNVEIMRAFVRLRRILADNAELARRFDDLEDKYDSQFKVVFDAIRKLMEKPKPEPQPPRKIGFHVSETVVEYGGGKRKRR